jgi:hypothetical protein
MAARRARRRWRTAPADRSPDPLAARRAPRRSLACTLVATLVACHEPAADPHRELPGSSTTEVDPTTGSPDPSSTGPQALDTGPDHSGYPPPDCAPLLLPGHPSDVAATPRPDHDAEVLALSVDPTQAVATQARYDTVTADLAAIRALDPMLEPVHVSCVLPNGIAFWFFDHEDVNAAIFAGDYHAWDCHDGYYHRLQELRIDGLAVAIELDGVYGEAVWQAYAALPGLDDQAPYWFQRDDWPVPTSTDASCTHAAGSITLTATLLPDQALDQRDYRFELESGEVVVYRITPTEPPRVVP